MSLRRRLALMICPELAPKGARLDEDAAIRAAGRLKPEERRAAQPCQMEARGPGSKRVYCVRCGEYVNVALPDPCPARAPTREELGLERVQFVDVDEARGNLREFKASRLSQRVDHGDDVVEGKGRQRVLAVGVLLLCQKLHHYVIGFCARSCTTM